MVTPLHLPILSAPPNCPNQPRHIIQTDTPGHLYLIWTRTPPVKTQKYIIKRGGAVPCGFTWALYNTNCVEQAETDQTLVHTFTIAPITPPQTIYWILSLSCAYTDGVWTTPPYTTVISAPGVGTFSAFGHKTTRTSWSHHIWGNWIGQIKDCDPDNMLPGSPFAYFYIRSAGVYFISVGFIILTNTTPASLSLRLKQNGGTEVYSLQNFGIMPASQQVAYTLFYKGYFPVGRQITWQGYFTGNGSWSFRPNSWAYIKKL